MIRIFFSFLKNTITRWDLVLIAFLIILTLSSFSFWFKGKPGQRAAIIVNGELVKEAYLIDQNETIAIQGDIGISYIEINSGRVRITDSPCPSKTCIKTGWIEQEGQMICCVPNKVLVKIINIKGGEKYDAQAR